jgi:hypothetical protein
LIKITLTTSSGFVFLELVAGSHEQDIKINIYREEVEPVKFPKDAANWEALTKGVSANRLQSGSIPGPPTWNLAGRASRGASPHPVAIPEPEVVIPEVEQFSIFWLSVEEEVLLSAPTPGGEVYLKLDQIGSN